MYDAVHVHDIELRTSSTSERLIKIELVFEAEHSPHI